MIIPFSTKFKDGTPTYFIKKIWESLALKNDFCSAEYRTFKETYNSLFKSYWDGFGTCSVNPKHHTIREDIHDRWHAGRLIHPVVFNRSKNQFQFAPTMTCISTQKIEIKHDNSWCNKVSVIIDGKILNASDKEQFKIIEVIAINDGFRYVSDFFAWFDHDFTGKIIHWTNLKY